MAFEKFLGADLVRQRGAERGSSSLAARLLVLHSGGSRRSPRTGISDRGGMLAVFGSLRSGLVPHAAAPDSMRPWLRQRSLAARRK